VGLRPADGLLLSYGFCALVNLLPIAAVFCRFAHKLKLALYPFFCSV